MKFMIDAALSLMVAEQLRLAGHEAVHVLEYEMHGASDLAIFERADQEGRVIVSADTDFGTLLALRESNAPSVVLFPVVLFRGGIERYHQRLVARLLDNLPSIEQALAEGSIVVLESTRLRIRPLPIQPN